MAAGKKGLIKTWYDELVDVYGKEQVVKVLIRGGGICIVSLFVPALYITASLTNMKPLPKPLPEPPKQKVK